MANFQFSVQDLMSNDTSGTATNPFYRESMKNLAKPLHTSGSTLKNADGSRNFDGYTSLGLTNISSALMGTPIADDPGTVANQQNSLLSGLLGASTQAGSGSKAGLGVFNGSIPPDVLTSAGLSNDPTNGTPGSSTGTTTGGGVGGGPTTGGVPSGSGAVPGLSVRQNVVNIAQQELTLWQNQPGYPTPTFSQTGYLKYSQNRAEQWCADFATWVYDQAGYPLRPDPQWNVGYVPNIQSIGQQEKNFHWHSSNYAPRPGDLAIHGSSHVNIFISSNGQTSTYIGGDQGSGPYPGGSNVSIETGNGYYSNGITGYVSPD